MRRTTGAVDTVGDAHGDDDAVDDDDNAVDTAVDAEDATAADEDATAAASDDDDAVAADDDAGVAFLRCLFSESFSILLLLLCCITGVTTPLTNPKMLAKSVHV